MTLLQNLPDWIYMLIGTIVFVVPAFIYLVAKGSAGKPDNGDSPLFPVAPMGVIEGFYSHDD